MIFIKKLIGDLFVCLFHQNDLQKKTNPVLCFVVFSQPFCFSKRDRKRIYNVILHLCVLFFNFQKLYFKNNNNWMSEKQTESFPCDNEKIDSIIIYYRKKRGKKYLIIFCKRFFIVFVVVVIILSSIVMIYRLYRIWNKSLTWEMFHIRNRFCCCCCFGLLIHVYQI